MCWVNILLHVAKMFSFLAPLRNCIRLCSFCSCLLEKLKIVPPSASIRFLCLERKQDCQSGEDVCEGAGLLSLLFVKAFRRNVNLPGWQAAFHIPEHKSSPHHPPLPVPYPPPSTNQPLQGPWIPTVTQELPPLLSAFFSSRSESWTSLGPNPGGQSGLLYRSYCFHEIGIWSIFLMHQWVYFLHKQYNFLSRWLWSCSTCPQCESSAASPV